jgi:hypothetical protein
LLGSAWNFSSCFQSSSSENRGFYLARVQWGCGTVRMPILWLLLRFWDVILPRLLPT